MHLYLFVFLQNGLPCRSTGRPERNIVQYVDASRRFFSPSDSVRLYRLLSAPLSCVYARRNSPPLLAFAPFVYTPVVIGRFLRPTSLRRSFRHSSALLCIRQTQLAFLPASIDGPSRPFRTSCSRVRVGLFGFFSRFFSEPNWRI